ncbi:polyribonucleotide nucleotidyltransferase [Candidatus Uhrbacteria bacterium RIFOXYB12_FULL_58_10]|uniref:Polyribonucleotide nucleotidyltransferase n=1 Tax=Candidatus Uhrbacteria bacterium RIFOXYB2_FULL_57_15 TaxID=1802422 RepID=A0A1F7WAX6_9BACT|nr:MAG: polyribonucleotide nucleotidyltransferase [Candidatus Uhrbacteria bacterium RIFOXYB12_FULL_58_10]OGL99367.1 MAG: polyribonucleotide nucleotidyltransferase [Candidatus Uhrbacteria bacterium RIFOXYB2_FULL_57_15]OGL99811.1 MAG: polyribonucleotide nucleotidyltransferase [Candidatus Uhrbacteria bacterium RIFOXYC12_FULL_57_11]
MQDTKKFSVQWGGKDLTIEVGKFANQANGSCTMQYGDTIVLATACMSEGVRDGLDFFPLQVEYEERFYAAGRIKGSRFMKKEGRPTDEAILVARYIDRAIRPLFDNRMRNEIQVVVTCLQFDGENDPDIIGLVAASCALSISDIPWNGPIADIRIGQISGEWVINPSYEARAKSGLDLSIAGTQDSVIMVEAGCDQVDEKTVLDAFTFGSKHLAIPLKLIEEVRAAVGKQKRDMVSPKNEDERAKQTRRAEVEALARPFIVAQVAELFFSTPKATKVERAKQKSELKKRLEVFLVEKDVEGADIKFGTGIAEEVLEHEVSRMILDEDKRVDGRQITEIRPLTAEVGLFKRLHGSGHFRRGETQVLSTVTLGAPGDIQTLDSMELQGTKRYFHHYNFPPYSVGECKPMRGPGRREIGHGALAEKAILPMLPGKEEFPYTIRVVSEVFGSNGSSSMGSTCGSSLALMDAGVPIKAAVAGMAMGLATDDSGRWKVITDLQDLEDGAGGMDFKIAGTRAGITAIQMDTKTKGIGRDVLEQTFKQAHEARLQILDVMDQAINAPRPELSSYAPRIITLRIDPELIGNVIGPGGKTINEIISSTGVGAIDIEDDGLVMITSVDAEAAQKAYDWVRNITRKAEVGEIFGGKVTRLMEFGAFVEFLPKQEGLVHVSELAPWRVAKVGDIVKIGDEVKVKVTEIDNLGRINLSMKQAPGNVYPEKPPETTQTGFSGGNSNGSKPPFRGSRP